MLEHQLQRAVADYLDRALPPDAWWSSIDSAGRGPIAGAKMKRRGVKRGIADVLIIAAGKPDYQGNPWLTLWIELKSAKGRMTVEQRRFFECVRRADHLWCVCTTVKAVEDALVECGIPLRARLT